MSVFRSYFEAQSGLIYNSLANTSTNEVAELVYGNIILNPYSSGETVYTRYIFRPNLDLLTQYINNNIIQPSNHTLRLYNTINLSEGLRGSLMQDDSRRAYGFTLNIYRLEESFVQGIGHDYRYSNVNTFSIGRYLNEQNDQAPNWFWKDTLNNWAVEGAISHTGNTLIASQYFELGTENLEVDFTDEINLILNNSIPNLGYCITFAPEFEEKQDDRLNKVHFFSMTTQTYFEPHIETYFDDTIVDSLPFQDSIILDQNNTIYIQSSCTPTGWTLYDHCENLITSSTLFNQINPNTYSVDIPALDSDVLPNHVNINLEYNCIGGKTCSIDLTTISNEVCLNKNRKIIENNEFSVTLSNLGQDERVKRNQIRKILVNVRNIQNLKGYIPLEYRIYTKQGNNEIEVQDWQKVSRLNNEYFFYLYTAWMIPKEYFIEFKVKENLYEYSQAFTFRFFISSEKNDGYR